MRFGGKEESYTPRMVDQENNDDWDLDKILESCLCSGLPTSEHLPT